MKPLSLSTPHLIIMVGIPGSGKSFFAEHFAATFGAPYVSFEKIASELFSEYTYTSEQQTIIANVSDYLLDQLFKTSQTIIYEGSTDTRSSRQLLANETRSRGYEPLFVWVQTESLAAKARATRHQPNKTPLPAEQFNTMLQRFTPPNATEKAIVISGKHTYASQLKIVLKHLADSRSQRVDTIQPTRSISEGRHIAIR